MRPLALLGCLAVLVLAGCGGDEEKRATSTETTETTRSAPATATQPPTETVQPQKPRTVTEPEAPSTGGGATAPKGEDSPGNDVPPPKGSPEERFEKRCKKSPEACG